MKNRRTRNRAPMPLICALAGAVSALGQGTLLIGPEIRNGGFEDGTISPWRDGVSPNVTWDASFASQGEWFLSLQASLGDACVQNVDVNPLDGRAFVLTFDARGSARAFDQVFGRLDGLNPDGSPVRPSVTAILAPAIEADGWSTYQTLFVFPETWAGGFLLLSSAALRAARWGGGSSPSRENAGGQMRQTLGSHHRRWRL